jgi:hypothetical protein
VALQFQHIFAGERIRPGEEQRDAFVQHQAIGIAERAVMGVARGQAAAADGLPGLAGQWAGKRTMPTPPRPWAVAMAAMVSRTALISLYIQNKSDR